MTVKGKVFAIQEDEKTKLVVLKISEMPMNDKQAENIQLSTNNQELLDGIKRGQEVEITIKPVE